MSRTTKTSKTTTTKSTPSSKTSKPTSYTPLTSKYQIPSSDLPSLSSYTTPLNTRITQPLTNLFDPSYPVSSRLLPIKNTLTNPDSNLIYFDHHLFSIHLYNPSSLPKSSTPDERSNYKDPNNKIIQISIDELKDYYEISKEHIDTFKRIYSTKAKHIFNTNPYPITDKTGNWLTLSYLIPFLFFTSQKFSNFYSNYLFSQIFNQSISDFDFESSISDTIYNKSILQLNLKPIPKPKTTDQTKAKTPSKASKAQTSYLVHLQSYPIIPSFKEEDKTNQSNLNNYIKKYKITSQAGRITNTDLNVIKNFYKSLNKSLYNPADITTINSIIKNGLTSSIKLVKSDNIEEELEKLEGIKTKTVQNQSWTSQKHFDVIYETVPSKTTLTSLYKYLKLEQSKVDKTKDLFEQLVEAANSDEYKAKLENPKPRTEKAETKETKTEAETKPKSKAKNSKINVLEEEDADLDEQSEEAEKDEQSENQSEKEEESEEAQLDEDEEIDE